MQVTWNTIREMRVGELLALLEKEKKVFVTIQDGETFKVFRLEEIELDKMR